MRKEIIFLILAWEGKGKREKKEGEKRRLGEAGKRRQERMDGGGEEGVKGGNGDQREWIRRKGEQEEAHGW